MINVNQHYFVLMHPQKVDPFLGIIYISTSSREKWVECKIVEDRYKVSDGYKVDLKSLEDGYARESFYQSDFTSLIKAGRIIPKTSDTQHVEEAHWIEPLCGDAYIHHSAYAVIDG